MHPWCGYLGKSAEENSDAPFERRPLVDFDAPFVEHYANWQLESGVVFFLSCKFGFFALQIVYTTTFQLTAFPVESQNFIRRKNE